MQTKPEPNIRTSEQRLLQLHLSGSLGLEARSLWRLQLARQIKAWLVVMETADPHPAQVWDMTRHQTFVSIIIHAQWQIWRVYSASTCFLIMFNAAWGGCGGGGVLRSLNSCSSNHHRATNTGVSSHRRDSRIQNTQLGPARPQREREGSEDDVPTRAEDAFVSGAGEVVTLAEGSVDLAELRLVAQTLVAAALSAPAADLLSLGFPAGAEVHVAGFALLALAAGAQVARLAAARPTGISTCRGKSSFSLGLSTF